MTEMEKPTYIRKNSNFFASYHFLCVQEGLPSCNVSLWPSRLRTKSSCSDLSSLCGGGGDFFGCPLSGSSNQISSVSKFTILLLAWTQVEKCSAFLRHWERNHFQIEDLSIWSQWLPDGVLFPREVYVQFSNHTQLKTYQTHSNTSPMVTPARRRWDFVLLLPFFAPLDHPGLRRCRRQPVF